MPIVGLKLQMEIQDLVVGNWRTLCRFEQLGRQVPNLQLLMQYICRAGFEHHVALNISQKADAITEALDSYMGWDVYRHS